MANQYVYSIDFATQTYSEEYVVTVFNILNYGADPTGANDSYTAINNAITDATAAGGGTILFPVPGTYKFGTQLNLNGSALLNFEGPSTGNKTAAPNTSPAGANLIYTGSTGPTATAPISLQAAKGITFKNLGIQWNNSGFTGYLVDCRQGSGANETTNIVFEDCTLAGTSTSLYENCAALVFLDGCYSIHFERTSFFGGNYNIIGIDVNGINYSSTVLFNECHFQDATTCAVQLPNTAWKFVSCVFEPLLNSAAGAITCLNGSTFYPGNGLDIDACWFGDPAETSSGTWINWYGNNLNVHGGCWIGVTAQTTFITIANNSCIGILLEGNVFLGTGGQSTVINFGTTTGHTGFVLLGNSYTEIITIISGTIPPGSVVEAYSGATLVSPIITNGIYGDNLTLESAIYPNLLTAMQADFETGGALGWAPTAACTIATTTAAAKHGTHSLAVTDSSGTVNQMSVGMYYGSAPYYSFIPVQPNTFYTALASFLCASGSTPRQIQIDMYAFDSSGVQIGSRLATTNAYPAVKDNTSTWTQLNVTAITPSNCAYIDLTVRWSDTVNLPVGEVHYLDTVQLTQGSSLVWQLPGTTPVTITAGSGAGTSPSVSISGNTNAGTITITTGSSPIANAVVATVNFTTSYSATPKIISLTSINGNAVTSEVWADSAAWTASSFTLNVGSTALSPSTTYKFGYVIFG